MEDLHSKERMENFMSIELNDPILKWERFLVSLRKDRFHKRSRAKRNFKVFQDSEPHSDIEKSDFSFSNSMLNYI